MKSLVTGASGQLGRALRATAPASAQVHALHSRQLDITDSSAVHHKVDELRPDWIINAAAYTAVDRAEDEPETAFAVNRDGAANLAEAAKRTGAHLIHVSTDYVFDGQSSRPYRPDDPTNPINVYGESKLAGENVLQDALPAEQWLIMRTAWVYGLPGQNFVTTMLRLFKERDELQVVCDQVGAPTRTTGLARALWRGAQIRMYGLHHWTDAGVASWYDFAIAIQSIALREGILTKTIPILPIGSEAFPTRAKRPDYSILEKQQTWDGLDIIPEHWCTSLKKALKAGR